MSQAMGTCPKCAGAGRMACPTESMRDYGKRLGWYGYDTATDTVPCDNCGGQTMAARGTGEVNLRPDGTPCLHEFSGSGAGRCLSRHTCAHCGYSYLIDSGD